MEGVRGGENSLQHKQSLSVFLKVLRERREVCSLVQQHAGRDRSHIESFGRILTESQVLMTLISVLSSRE